MSATAVLRLEATECEYIGVMNKDLPPESQSAEEPCRLIYDAECRLCVTIQ